MTNFEWIKSLSVDEFVDWFYDEWISHLQYQYNSSRGGLKKWLMDDSRPQGQWMESIVNPLAHAYCSLCGWEALYYETDVIDEANYCPNCGAKMKGMNDE